MERGLAFKAFGSAYAVAHATRPSTMGIVLSSNPLALLAWYVTLASAHDSSFDYYYYHHYHFHPST
jgi:hypothetical protein